MSADPILTPEQVLTVVIRDESPMAINEPFTYRTVRIELTPDQQARLRLRHRDETVQMAILEVRDAGSR